jgi:hypothetical protein
VLLTWELRLIFQSEDGAASIGFDFSAWPGLYDYCSAETWKAAFGD